MSAIPAKQFFTFFMKLSFVFFLNCILYLWLVWMDSWFIHPFPNNLLFNILYWNSSCVFLVCKRLGELSFLDCLLFGWIYISRGSDFCKCFEYFIRVARLIITFFIRFRTVFSPLFYRVYHCIEVTILWGFHFVWEGRGRRLLHFVALLRIGRWSSSWRLHWTFHHLTIILLNKPISLWS